MGAIELLQTRFHYRQETVFNASTYLGFLNNWPPTIAARAPFSFRTTLPTTRTRGLVLVQANRHWLEVHQLPPYSPEFNPTERLWQYTRRTGTHDRYFAQPSELLATLTRVFRRDAIPPGADPTPSGFFLLTIMSLYLCAAV